VYKIYVLLDVIIIIRQELGFDRPVSARLIVCYFSVNFWEKKGTS